MTVGGWVDSILLTSLLLFSRKVGEERKNERVGSLFSQLAEQKERE